MNPVNVLKAVKYFGLRRLLLGLWHRFTRKSGILKHRFPTYRWEDLDPDKYIQPDCLGRSLRHLVSAGRFFPVFGLVDRCRRAEIMPGIEDSIINAADNIINGNFRYFFNTFVAYPEGIDWHLNPFTQKSFDRDSHWCQIDFFDADKGDVKCVWELSRFYWAYDLARAYAISGDEKYPACFWRLFEDWLSENPPNKGVNWASGQECALRIMACCFALFAFIDSESTTDERTGKLLVCIITHAERIEGFISHAVRQKTNHALTEAVGLYTVGTVFPFFKKAKHLAALGKKILEQQGLEQIYPDGGYVQQSMNYHRLMLHAYLWALRLGQINGDVFSGELRQRLGRATDFLFNMQDGATGRVPLYGDNDGALILPVNSCDYLDFRPVVQAMSFLLDKQRVYENGPWDEDLFWLFGAEALDSEKADRQRQSAGFAHSGYYTLRGKRSWAMIRCHSYCGRVGHVDMLHFDLWADGINLLRDCGTYSYFAPEEPQTARYFRSIRAHNTVIIDNTSPLRLLSRFMWIPWPKAQVESFEWDSSRIYWRGRSHAYDRRPWNVLHTREIIADRDDDRWTVVDTIEGTGSHTVELRWHLPLETEVDFAEDNAVGLKLPAGHLLGVRSDSPISHDLLKAQPDGGRQSPYYNSTEAISTLAIRTVAALPVRFETTIETRR